MMNFSNYLPHNLYGRSVPIPNSRDAPQHRSSDSETTTTNALSSSHFFPFPYLPHHFFTGQRDDDPQVSPIAANPSSPGGHTLDGLHDSEGRHSLDHDIDELYDPQRDMVLYIDDMSYEELLALEERLGYVSTGLSEDKINKQMIKYEAASSMLELCCICQDDYVAGDDIRKLDCGHEFHPACIRQWLRLKNICPLCKRTAIPT